MSTIKTQIAVQRVVSNRVSVFYPNKWEVTDTVSTVYHQTTQIIGVAEELLSIGDVTNDAGLYLVNNHASAIIQMGLVVAATFYPVVRVPPGKIAKWPIVHDVAALYLKSDTADTPAEILLFKL